VLAKIADRVEAHGEELALTRSNNCGKPYAAALNDEIPPSPSVFRSSPARRGASVDSAAASTCRPASMIRRDPIGVIAQITPWNYPLMMAAWKMAPALAAGNTLVLKPSEITPLTSLRFFELIGDLLPPGVANVVFGRGNKVGQPLVSAPAVRMISLTGSIATGQKMLEVAAATLKRTHLELGGKAPVIVFDDANLATWSPASAPSATTTRDRTARRPAASTRRARGTTTSSRTLPARCRASSPARRTKPASSSARSCPRCTAIASRASSIVPVPRSTSRS
jgi:aminobutyraldehyde dehydrogenase